MKGLGKRAYVLRRTEYQEARGLEGVLQDRPDLALQHVAQVDQHVAATDQVQLGERRVLCQVVPGKHAHVTDILTDLVPVFGADEEAR